MTREEKIEILEKEKAYMIAHGGDRQAEALTSAIKALEKEPCEDAIKRQAVKDWFCTNYCSEHNKCEHFEKGDCNAMIELFAISPVKPQDPLTEEDYIELHDRFGDYAEFVVRDMVSGKGERWTKKECKE